MNEKLKKIATKLVPKYNPLTLEETYQKFMRQVATQKDYFGTYKPYDLLRIVFYIFSLKETGNFDWAETVLKKAYLGDYFEYTADDFVSESCDDCNGNGSVECDYCNGSGTEECDKCSGDGQIDCNECDGEGSIEDENGNLEDCEECNGKGEIECDWCSGSGERVCGNCNDGYNTCYECDGSGEIESDKLRYYATTFVTWDKQLIDSFMLSYELKKPIVKDDYVTYANENKMLVLRNGEDEAEFKENIKPDYQYCYNMELLEEEVVGLMNNQIDSYATPGSSYVI